MAGGQSQLRYIQGRRLVMAGVMVNICLTLVKIAGGIVGHSQALIADGFHSLSDLVTDMVVFFGLRYSAKPRDANHPYGHGKIETLAAVFVGMLLLATGALLAFGGVRSALVEPAAPPTMLALVVVILSILFKEVLYQYTLRYARRLNSTALVANAWHHRSDALSSVAALVGIAGARLGLPVLDPLAAVAVALMILKVGADVILVASRELVEETMKDEETARMVELALAVHGVEDVPELHSRSVGPAVVVDMSISVDGALSVEQGHDIAHAVEQALTGAIPRVETVSVHVEPHQPSGLPAHEAL